MERNNDIVVVSGFGDKGIPEFINALFRMPQAGEIAHIEGCPQSRGNIHPDELTEDIVIRLRERADPFLLVGHSYGALLALAAACRVQFQKILKLILIDGPLNPHETVSPPKDGSFDAFMVQYFHRVGFCEDCLGRLNRMPARLRQSIVTTGSIHDATVPLTAKWLPGIHHHDMPEDIIGHSLTPEKIQALIASGIFAAAEQEPVSIRVA